MEQESSRSHEGEAPPAGLMPGGAEPFPPPSGRNILEMTSQTAGQQSTMAPPLTLPCVSYLAVLLVLVDASSSSGGRKNFQADLHGHSLTDLYNSPVMTAERVKRPFGSSGSGSGGFSHTGVRVTLEDGSQWLVHKGRRYGDASETVVTRAGHMSDKWKVIQTKNFDGSKTVSDLVRAGGTKYNLLRDNCHHASRRMMNLGGRSSNRRRN
ncbi:uncharacterized protein LOC112136742 isoform X1 [Oryzias melastigma]|uniref:uncharacterized protein LOC112136742 isoform X1 n=1 Tax=Oryzias melastigma TaxID=30732 RepID=UPI000CF83CDB|nr:uncharacterized protein LOC112136742 isoform X1 [Oryzias melastigma]XP_036071879.1 uncharacterized protein LOC112136742 isoform X1 [Oryzias melastigma]